MSMSQQTLFENPLSTAVIGGVLGALLGCGGFLVAVQQGWLVVAPASESQTQGIQLQKDISSTNVAGLVDVSDIVEQVNPSVVSIVIKKDVPVMERYYEDPFNGLFGGNSPFRFSIPRMRQNGTQEQEVGGGSGFFISNDGYIVTNAHVVSDTQAKYSVVVNDGSTIDATVIAIDDVLDIALIKVEGDAFPFLQFGDSDVLRLGQGVIAIGNALGEFRNTVSTGVVSGLSRSITAGNGSSSEQLENVIQTDAAINPGNSGGPLLDQQGKVVGVNVAVAGNSENIGFSLPINVVRSSIESMKSEGRVIRPYLGVRYVPVTEELVKANKLSVDYGVLVLRGETREELAVIPGSPADKAGIEENDLILAVDGQTIEANHSLASMIRGKSVGQEIELKIQHKGEEKIVKIKLEETPSP